MCTVHSAINLNKYIITIMYSFQFIASTTETDRILQDISVFRINYNMYQLNNHTFRVYTSLSPASIHCKFFVISWDEWKGDLINEVTSTITNNKHPYALLFFNVPNELNDDELYSFTTIYKYAYTYSIPFIYKRMVEKEMRDELYYQLFLHFIDVLSKEKIKLENDIILYKDNIIFLDIIKDTYCNHIHGTIKYNKLHIKYHKICNEIITNIKDNDINLIRKTRCYNELYRPYRTFISTLTK